ncbi:MAG: restriction endonuclease subunit S [Dehalococcoidia bacterium]|nr:restriction endonuclease subunit S [Dehalococcoidia bacterium]
MIADLTPYPAMKDSGVTWLKAVPEHWEVRRLRNVAELRVSTIDKHVREDESPVRLCNYVDVYKNDRIRPGMSFMFATARAEDISRFRLEDGDVLITKDSEVWTDIGVPALVDGRADDLVSGYHLALLRPRARTCVGAFLFRALQSLPVAYQFHIEATGVTRYGLSHDAIKSVWLPAPPLDEQAAIVRYLDYMDGRIRRYIRAKQRLIKLLEEERNAVTHRAVTGELDVRTGQPYPAYKASGVEWLGDVPEEWGVRRLKEVSDVQTGVTLGKNYASQPLVERPYLRVANVQMGSLDLREVKTIRLPVAEARRSVLKPGDVLMTEGGDADKLGRGTIWAGQINDCLHQNHVFAVRPYVDQLNADYLIAILSGRPGRWYFQLTAKQTTNLAATNSTTLGRFALPLPNSSQQDEIVAWIADQTRGTAAAIDRATREVQLLHEYRTRLIADVVTGKLDVREAAAKLPDEPDEDGTLEEEELVDELKSDEDGEGEDGDA